eukprot:6679226-Prymnesium_polylepis.1
MSKLRPMVARSRGPTTRSRFSMAHAWSDVGLLVAVHRPQGVRSLWRVGLTVACGPEVLPCSARACDAITVDRLCVRTSGGVE